MNLRILIFFTVAAIGILPLTLFLLFNLPSSIHQLELAAQQETEARSRIHFSNLNSRISGLEEGIRRLAAVPVSRDVVGLGGEDELLRRRLTSLVAGWFDDNEQFREAQFIDLVGNERFGMVRQGPEMLPVARDALKDLERTPAFLIGLHLQPGEVFVGVSSNGGEAGDDLFMVTPVSGPAGAVTGLLVLLVELPVFLADFHDAFWVLGDGRLVHLAPGVGESPALPAQVSDPAEEGTDEPFIQSVADRQFSWLPLSFNKGYRPTMWVGRPVDLSSGQQWKSSLFKKLALIVTATALLVFGLAHFITSRLMLVRQEILVGLDQLLNHGRPARFSWQGPAELSNLAADLGQLGDLYLQTRKARRQAEAARLESEEKFRNLTESAHDAIVFMDDNGDITYWNKAAETFFGFSAAEALGQPIHALISLQRGDGGEDVTAPTASGQLDEMLELSATGKDGQEISLELSLSATSINDRWHAIWIIRDISERQRAAAEALLQQQQLVQADKMISLGLLVSGVAHEINNPNSIVMLNTPLIQRAWQSVLPILDEFYEDNGDFLVAGLEYSEMRGQLDRLCDEIEEGSRKIKGIVLDLKDYARQESTARQEELDLNEVARAAVRLTRNVVKNASHHFRLELAAKLPAIRGNMQRLEQVVINLIQNSCEALSGPEKGVVVRTGFERGQVFLQVEDEGCGIDRQDLSKVCDPFYTTKRSLGGTGLGLSVSAGIVKEHNGLLEFSPRPGGGTIALLAFPVAQEEE
ncbi:MAG: ATP-binding protein [Thermodesulfobacteriota bacterium]